MTQRQPEAPVTIVNGAFRGPDQVQDESWYLVFGYLCVFEQATAMLPPEWGEQEIYLFNAWIAIALSKLRTPLMEVYTMGDENRMNLRLMHPDESRRPFDHRDLDHR